MASRLRLGATIWAPSPMAMLPLLVIVLLRPTPLAAAPIKAAATAMPSPRLSIAWVSALARLIVPVAALALTVLLLPSWVLAVWLVVVLLWAPAPASATLEAPRAALTLSAVRVSVELERRVTFAPLTLRAVLSLPSRSHTSGSELALPRLVVATITPKPAANVPAAEPAPP